MPKNIVLKGTPIRKEEQAGGTITPGALITYNGDGAVIVHATVGGSAVPAFAVEEDFMGNNIDKDYTTGNRVQYVIAGPGDEIFGIASTGQTIAKGDFLVSAGNGKLAKYAAQKIETAHATDVTVVLNCIVGRALEAVTTTTGTARIKVEVI